MVDRGRNRQRCGLQHFRIPGSFGPTQHYTHRRSYQDGAQSTPPCSRHPQGKRLLTVFEALLASPRNSLKAHLSLLDDTQCHIMMTVEPLPPSAKDVLANRSMRQVMVPKLEHWLDSPIVAPYLYNRTFDQARYEPFVVIHTSGSTGKSSLVLGIFN